MESSAGKALAPVSYVGGGALRRLLDIAIDGIAGVPSARSTAASALSKRQEHEAAIELLVRNHIMMAGAQGFVTNIGGFATLAVSLPANVTGVAIVQLRMVAGIAHLRGYDVADPRVRSAIMACLLARQGGWAQGRGADLPTHPQLIATAPVFDAELDREISERVVAELLASVGGRRTATLMARRVPLLGSGVGLALDSWSTQQVARFTVAELASRRAS